MDTNMEQRLLARIILDDLKNAGLIDDAQMSSIWEKFITGINQNDKIGDEAA